MPEKTIIKSFFLSLSVSTLRIEKYLYFINVTYPYRCIMFVEQSCFIKISVMHYEKTTLGSINKDFERKSEKTEKER